MFLEWPPLGTLSVKRLERQTIENYLVAWKPMDKNDKIGYGHLYLRRILILIKRTVNVNNK